MTEKLLKTSEVLTEVFKDEISEDEIDEILRLNSLQEEISEKEAEQLIENVEDLLYLKVLTIPGYFEELYFEIKNPEEFLRKSIEKINQGNYKNLNEGILDLTKLFFINILSTNISETVDLFNPAGEDVYDSIDDFIHLEDGHGYEILFKDLGKGLKYEDLYDCIDTNANMVQYNAYNNFSHLGLVTEEEGKNFRVYPASELQMRVIFNTKASVFKNFTIHDYINILDGESALFSLEFWGGQIGDKNEDLLGYMYYSYENAINDKNPIILSDNLKKIFNNIKLDSIERNNRINDEDTENIKKIFELMKK